MTEKSALEYIHVWYCVQNYWNSSSQQFKYVFITSSNPVPALACFLATVITAMAARMPRVIQQNANGKAKRGRVKVAEYDPDVLKNNLEAYVKSVGVNKAFDLHSYKSLPVSYAARGNDLVKMHKWVMAILSVNPQGRLLVSFLFFCFNFL